MNKLRLILLLLLCTMLLYFVNNIITNNKVYSIDDFGIKYNQFRVRKGLCPLSELDTAYKINDHTYKYTSLRLDSNVTKYITVRYGMMGGEKDHHYISDSTIVVVSLNYINMKTSYCLLSKRQNVKEDCCIKISKKQAVELIEKF